MPAQRVSELGEGGEVLRSRLRIQAALLDKGLQSMIGAALFVIGTYISVIWLGQLMSFTTFWLSLSSVGGALVLALFNLNRGLPRLTDALNRTSVVIKLVGGEYREQMFTQETRITANLLQVTLDEHSIVRMAVLLGLELERFVVVPRRRMLWLPVLGGATLLCVLAFVVELVRGRGVPEGALFLPVVFGVLLYLFLDWVVTRVMRVVTLLRHAYHELGGA